MLRKFFSTALAAVLILFAGAVSADTSVQILNVAVILEPPLETFESPEKISAAVTQTVSKIFKNNSRFHVQSIDETAGEVQIYREENNLEGAALKKTDLDKICQNLGSDFVIYIRTTTTEVEASDPIGRKVNVVLDFRVWSNDKKDFTYTRRTTMTGTGYGYGAAADAVVAGFKKAVQEVEKDASRVRAAM